MVKSALPEFDCLWLIIAVSRPAEALVRIAIWNNGVTVLKGRAVRSFLLPLQNHDALPTRESGWVHLKWWELTRSRKINTSTGLCHYYYYFFFNWCKIIYETNYKLLIRERYYFYILLSSLRRETIYLLSAALRIDAIYFSYKFHWNWCRKILHFFFFLQNTILIKNLFRLMCIHLSPVNVESKKRANAFLLWVVREHSSLWSDRDKSHWIAKRSIWRKTSSNGQRSYRARGIRR